MAEVLTIYPEFSKVYDALKDAKMSQVIIKIGNLKTLGLKTLTLIAPTNEAFENLRDNLDMGQLMMHHVT